MPDLSVGLFLESGGQISGVDDPIKARVSDTLDGLDQPEAAELSGTRVLVVEDEFFVALYIEDVLNSLGCVVVGPVANLADAMVVAATKGALDGAILDVNLRGELVYPLAEQLIELRTPFIFATGYASVDIPERFRGIHRLRKPFARDALRRGIGYMR